MAIRDLRVLNNLFDEDRFEGLIEKTPDMVTGLRGTIRNPSLEDLDFLNQEAEKVQVLSPGLAELQPPSLAQLPGFGPDDFNVEAPGRPKVRGQRISNFVRSDDTRRFLATLAVAIGGEGSVGAALGGSTLAELDASAEADFLNALLAGEGVEEATARNPRISSEGRIRAFQQFSLVRGEKRADVAAKGKKEAGVREEKRLDLAVLASGLNLDKFKHIKDVDRREAVRQIASDDLDKRITESEIDLNTAQTALTEARAGEIGKGLEVISVQEIRLSIDSAFEALGTVQDQRNMLVAEFNQIRGGDSVKTEEGQKRFLDIYEDELEAHNKRISRLTAIGDAYIRLSQERAESAGVGNAIEDDEQDEEEIPDPIITEEGAVVGVPQAGTELAPKTGLGSRSRAIPALSLDTPYDKNGKLRSAYKNVWIEVDGIKYFTGEGDR